MLPTDHPIWWTFLHKYGELFSTIYYDVQVGGPRYTKAQLEDPLMRMWQRVTSKRIDAIGERDKEIWIIEVSAGSGMRALGQLLTYQKLWNEDPKIAKPVLLVLIMETIDPDIATAIVAAGVHLYLVPRDRRAIPYEYRGIAPLT